ncbi:MAG: M1 family metallopeptidase [Anaerolineae bacterium]|nr:M1 family metallopeptidase [Anaerolineae bacterium]
MKQLWLDLLLILISSVGIAACGDDSPAASRLPTLAPTRTAVPLSTPTGIPAPDPIQLPAANWDDLAPFRAAMRPEFAADVDTFAHRNRYTIEAALEFEGSAAVIRGAERVRYTNRSADTLTEIVFRLYPNLPVLGGRMKIYQAELNGAPVAPILTERDTVLIIPLTTPLDPSDSAEITLTFSTAAEQGIYSSYGEFGFHNEVFSGPEWYPALSVYEEGRGWWMTRPTAGGDATYLETGLYDIYLTAPQDFVIVMSGTEAALETNARPVGAGQQLHHIVSGPMRDSLLVASPRFSTITATTAGGIAVNVYYWPDGELAAQDALRIGIDALTTFNAAFGPYPFAEFDIVETFNWTGIEYPGMTVISDRYWEPGNASLENIIVHEVAHQWFYSLVGNNQVEHPWLDEALASYAEYVYWRTIYGEAHYQAVVEGDRATYTFYMESGAPDMVLDLPVSAYTPGNNYSLIIYVKGPLFFLELENRLGRDAFQQAIQLYVTRHYYEIVTARDMLAAFEDATGADLDALFYEWVGAFDGLDPAVID